MQADLDTHWMRQALELAQRAAGEGEVPVGAVVVLDDAIIGRGYNSPITHNDPSHHAEIAALRDACEAVGNYRLPGATLYVTIEPCTMCVGAIIHARVSRLVFGAREPRAGAVTSRFSLLEESGYNHKVSWSEGILAEECGSIMRDFFRSRR